MLFGLYLMFELFLLIGYFAYSYDHITGYTRVRKHPREMHPAEYLIGITIFTFLSIDLNGQIMLSDILIYPANASSVFYLRCGWSLLLLAALTVFLLFFKKLTAERRYLAAKENPKRPPVFGFSLTAFPSSNILPAALCSS